LDSWFEKIPTDYKLPTDLEKELYETGFVVLPGTIANSDFPSLSAAYDLAVSNAEPDDVHIGSTSIRVVDFVNRGPEFDGLYTCGPLLAACCSVIRQPFKLSSFHARTLKPYSIAQTIHTDIKQDDGWPLIGFIVMIDEFRPENGATRFVPGSHLRTDAIKGPSVDSTTVPACGPAGSMIIYNGSAWHGHGANTTSRPRRSIQGAFIRRDLESAVNWANQITADTQNRIGNLAKYLLDVQGR